ncbi:hypothetical protein S40293_10513 [Stachybotrys chartarum IBT 40293]|nr:hypothetical protein S40293_10513 [Stachybotrys chartarum IBT 40293]
MATQTATQHIIVGGMTRQIFFPEAVNNGRCSKPWLTSCHDEVVGTSGIYENAVPAEHGRDPPGRFCQGVKPGEGREGETQSTSNFICTVWISTTEMLANIQGNGAVDMQQSHHTHRIPSGAWHATVTTGSPSAAASSARLPGKHSISLRQPIPLPARRACSSQRHQPLVKCFILCYCSQQHVVRDVFRAL